MAARELSNDVRDHLERLAERARAWRNLEQALTALGREKRKVWSTRRSAADALARLIKSAGGTVVSAADPVALMKAVKNETEIAGARKAHVRDGAAVVRFLLAREHSARDGKLSEIEAVEALETFRHESSLLKDISFPTIAGAGPDGAIVHYRVTKRHKPSDCPRRVVSD